MSSYSTSTTHWAKFICSTTKTGNSPTSCVFVEVQLQYSCWWKKSCTTCCILKNPNTRWIFWYSPYYQQLVQDCFKFTVPYFEIRWSVGDKLWNHQQLPLYKTLRLYITITLIWTSPPKKSLSSARASDVTIRPAKTRHTIIFEHLCYGLHPWNLKWISKNIQNSHIWKEVHVPNHNVKFPGCKIAVLRQSLWHSHQPNSRCLSNT